MRYSRAVIDCFCVHARRKPQLGQHASTKLSSLSCLLEQLHTNLCQNDEYPPKHILFPTHSSLQTSEFMTSSTCNGNTTRSPSPYRLKCISNWTYYELSSPLKFAFLHFKTSVCSKSKEMLLLFHPVTTHCDIARWHHPCSKSCNKTSYFL